MQYLLDEAEYEALTPVQRVNDKIEALEIARKLIVTDERCMKIHYCCDCPIGQIRDHKIRNAICSREKHWPK